MNKDKIDFIVSMEPFVEPDVYADSIVEILTPPKWYQFKKRRQYTLRVRVVMSEYAKELLRAINQTPTTVAKTPTTTGKEAVKG